MKHWPELNWYGWITWKHSLLLPLWPIVWPWSYLEFVVILFTMHCQILFIRDNCQKSFTTFASQFACTHFTTTFLLFLHVLFLSPECKESESLFTSLKSLASGSCLRDSDCFLRKSFWSCNGLCCSGICNGHIVAVHRSSEKTSCFALLVSLKV